MPGIFRSSNIRSGTPIPSLSIASAEVLLVAERTFVSGLIARNGIVVSSMSA